MLKSDWPNNIVSSRYVMALHAPVLGFAWSSLIIVVDSGTLLLHE
jgi:hypothetical protein